MRYILIILITLFFTSCGGNNRVEEKNEIFGDVQPPEICNQESKKLFVYDVMHDSYLWAGNVEVLSEQEILNIEDDAKILERLKSSEDRFSHIMKKDVHDNYFQAGVNTGFGFYPSLTADEKFINIDFVYPGSPSDEANLKRGDVISTIDGFTIDEIRTSEVLYNKYFGNPEDNLTITLKLQDATQMTVASEEFKIDTILHKSIIEQNGTKIGYFVFQNFIGTASYDINKVFQNFKEQNVNDLILDLRYNGGGYVHVAKELVSLIGGNKVSGKIFNQVRFNQKYSKYNSIDYIAIAPKNSLNLSRVFIITTSSSCSASELVINALKSSANNIEVIQIGSPTCGKPYGMIGGAYCDSYILPVQIENVNGDGDGGYVDGIVPFCQSEDDVSLDFGDKNESSLSQVLFYIDNNSCKTKSSRHIKSERKEILRGFGKIYGIF